MKKRSPVSTLAKSIGCIATAIVCSASVQASTQFNFTGNGGSTNFGNTVVAMSDDGSLTATITASRHGSTSGVSGFNLDGYGVADGGYRSIQGNETLHITFSQAVDIDTLHLRQWEGPDEGQAVISFNGGTTTQTISADTGGAFDTNEYVALNATGVTSLDITGIYTGTLFFVEKTQFFVAGLQGVTASPSEVPVPAAAWLFGSALLGLGQLKRRKG